MHGVMLSDCPQLSVCQANSEQIYMTKLKKCCNFTSHFFNLVYFMYANFLNPCRFLMNKGSKPWRTLGRSSQAVDAVVGKFLKLNLSHFCHISLC